MDDLPTEESRNPVWSRAAVWVIRSNIKWIVFRLLLQRDKLLLLLQLAF